MARTTTSVNRLKQTTVKAAAKRGRIEEAGLGGRRTGKASATTKAAQAKRDERQAEAAVAAKPAPKSAPKPAAKAKSPPAGPRAAGVAKEKASIAAPATSKSRRERSGPLVEVRTSHSVAGNARLDGYAESVVMEALSRFAPGLTRIDVYFNDQNADKKGSNDKHCQVEARPASSAPVSAAASAATVEKALALAIGKMKRLLATHFDKRSDVRKGR